MARRSRIRRSAKRSKNLIWVTTLVQSSFLEDVPLDVAELVLPTDWSLTAGFDRATLLGIRGWLHVVQTAAATITEATGVYGAIYVADAEVVSGSFDPSTAVDYDGFDVLWSTGLALNANSGAQYQGPGEQIVVKTKRRLTSAQSVRLAFCTDADSAGAPRVNVNGCLRSLLQTD